MDTTTTQSLDLFLTALLGQNYSPKTLRAYRDDLKQFIQWVSENRVDWDNPKRFTRVDIEGYMSYLAGQHMTGVTRVRKLAAIRKFQIPPDLVVKSQAVDITEIFEPTAGDETSSTGRVVTGHHEVSCSQHSRPIGLPLNPMECGLFC